MSCSDKDRVRRTAEKEIEKKKKGLKRRRRRKKEKKENMNDK